MRFLSGFGLAQFSQTGKELDQPTHGNGKSTRIRLSQICASQEVCTNHLQAIPAGSLKPEHQGGRLKRPLDYLQLAFVNLEIKHLYLTLKLFFRQLLRFVQPGCTVEALTVPA